MMSHITEYKPSSGRDNVLRLLRNSRSSKARAVLHARVCNADDGWPVHARTALASESRTLESGDLW
jgi:hypothetical protein